MSLLKITAVSATIVVASLSLAMAQGAGTGPVANACKGEIEKFCAGKPHGGSEVRACLDARKSEASAACKAALDQTGSGKGMGMGKGK